MTKSWYVVNSYSGYENKAKEQLIERIDREGLNEFFGGIEVPTQTITEVKAGKEKITEKKFFPGYVLVQMEMNDETWHLVKETPRVLGFIGGKADMPAPITDKEADAILQRVQDSEDKPRPKTVFDAGEIIRVIDGPFNDFNGVVEEVNYEKSRVRVSVSIFGRNTPVELEFVQVEKI